ncbi:MAG: glycoside hydrolase, partial [Planctomycetes bacterium]|nr:glycoside hydrolase [Planctomycetota bacterium]
MAKSKSARTKPYRAFYVQGTHWDREWYLPFQEYRARLVFIIDKLLEIMERNKAFRSFFLDGQTAVVEDYLAIRPENEKRLMKLIRSGRVLVGPWFVMPDES